VIVQIEQAHQLVVTEGPLRGTTIPLAASPILLGRAQEATLVLEDDYASGRHARVRERQFELDGPKVLNLSLRSATAESYTTDPLDALGSLYRDGGLTVLEGRPAIPMPVGRCVGGTTVINSGTCVRTPGDVLAHWRDEVGISWATDLEAEFEPIERDLAVTPLDPAAAGRNAQICRAGADALGAANHAVARNAGHVVRCGACPRTSTGR